MLLKSLRTLSISIALTTMSLGCSSSTESPTPSSPLLGGRFDASQNINEPSKTEEERFLELQKKELDKQAQEIEDLKRQKFHDDYLRSRYPQANQDAEPARDGFGGY